MKLGLFVVAAVLVFGACGDDGGGPADSGGVAAPPSTDATGAEPETDEAAVATLGTGHRVHHRRPVRPCLRGHPSRSTRDRQPRGLRALH